MLAYLQGPHRVRDDGSSSQPPPSRPGAPTGPWATRPTALRSLCLSVARPRRLPVFTLSARLTRVPVHGRLQTVY